MYNVQALRIARHIRDRYGTLLVYSFLQILGQVHLAYLGSRIVGSHFLHIMLHHQSHQLFETGTLRVPTQFFLCFARIAKQVHYIGRTIEIRTDCNNDLSLCTLYLVPLYIIYTLAR